MFLISCLAPAALYVAVRASAARGQKRLAHEAALVEVAFSGVAFGLAPLIALQLAAPPGAGAPPVWAAAAALFAFAGFCSTLIISRYRLTVMSLTASSLVYALLAIAGFAAALATQTDGARGMLTIATMTAAPFSLLLHWLVFSGAGPLRRARPLVAGVAVGAVMTLAASRLGPQDAGLLFAPSRLFWLAVCGALTFAALRLARREQIVGPAAGGAVTLDDLPDDLLAYVVGADNCVQATTSGARHFFRLEPSLPQGRAAPVLTPLPADEAGALYREGKAGICCFTDRAGVAHYVRIHERELGAGKNGSLRLVIAEPIGDLIEQQIRWNALNDRIASVIDANDDMLMFMSESGLVTEVNRCALHFLKKARKECVGNYVWNLFPQTEASLSAAEWRNLLTGAMRNGAVRAEAVLAGAEGQERLFKFNLSKARSHKGAAPEFICFGRDITDVTEAQKSFQDAQARLEQTIASRTKELRDAKRAADDANLSKSRFLANMSHELRTPLNAILGYTDLMRQDLADEDKKETQEYKDLDRVTVNARNLLNLINDILDLSKVEANKMTLSYSAVSVSELLDETTTSIEPLVMKRGNLLIVDAAENVTSVTVDRQKVTQCLLNLLSNASKFTEGGRISLKLWESAAEGASMIYFEVRDTGKGMTPQQCETIFDEFVQIEDPDKLSAGGTGLGLPITKRFCRLMGGDIIAASAPGAGSRFTMWVRNGPVEPARAQAEEDAA